MPYIQQCGRAIRDVGCIGLVRRLDWSEMGGLTRAGFHCSQARCIEGAVTTYLSQLLARVQCAIEKAIYEESPELRAKSNPKDDEDVAEFLPQIEQETERCTKYGLEASTNSYNS